LANPKVSQFTENQKTATAWVTRVYWIA